MQSAFVMGGAFVCAWDGCLLTAVLVLMASGLALRRVALYIALGHIVVGSVGVTLSYQTASLHPAFPYLFALFGYVMFGVFHLHPQVKIRKLPERRGCWGEAGLLVLAMALSIDSFPWGADSFGYTLTDHWGVGARHNAPVPSPLKSYAMIAQMGLVVGLLTLVALLLTRIFVALCEESDSPAWMRRLQYLQLRWSKPVATWMFLMLALRAAWKVTGFVAYDLALHFPRMSFVLRAEQPPSWWVSLGVALLLLSVCALTIRERQATCCASCANHAREH